MLLCFNLLSPLLLWQTWHVQSCCLTRPCILQKQGLISLTTLKESHIICNTYSSYQRNLTGEEWKPKWACILQRQGLISLATSSLFFLHIQLLFESCPPNASVKTVKRFISVLLKQTTETKQFQGTKHKCYFSQKKDIIGVYICEWFLYIHVRDISLTNLNYSNSPLLWILTLREAPPWSY